MIVVSTIFILILINKNLFSLIKIIITPITPLNSKINKTYTLEELVIYPYILPKEDQTLVDLSLILLSLIEYINKNESYN